MGCQNPKDIQVLITGGHSVHGLHVQLSRLSAHALTAKLHCKQSLLSLPLTLLYLWIQQFPKSAFDCQLVVMKSEIANLDFKYLDTIYYQNYEALVLNVFQSTSMWTTC